MTVLEGDGFRLRPWQEGDEEDIVNNMNNKKITDNLLIVPFPYKREYAVEWLEDCRKNKNPKHARFAIEIDGKAAGGIAFADPLEHDTGEVRIGYWLGEKYWNRGVMTQAIKLITEHGFEDLGIKSISACVFTRNPASGRVLEKAGYENKGEIKCCYEKNGEKIDAVQYLKEA